MRIRHLPLICALALSLTVGCSKKEDEAKAKAAAESAAAALSGALKQATKPAKAAEAPAQKSPHPATMEGAKAMLSEFLKPGADYVKLSMALKPTSADYAKVFASPEVAKKAEMTYGSLWGMIQRRPIKPNEGQTELLLWKATTDELKAGSGDAGKFPGGYKKAAPHLNSGLTVYRFKFVKPGKTLGMAFDGLYNIDGRWVIMPKPWRITRGM